MSKIETKHQQEIAENFDKKLTIIPSSPALFLRIEKYLKKVQEDQEKAKNEGKPYGEITYVVRGGKHGQLLKSTEEEDAEREYCKLTGDLRFRLRTATPKDTDGNFILDESGNKIKSEVELVRSGEKSRLEIIQARIDEIQQSEPIKNNENNNDNNGESEE